MTGCEPTEVYKIPCEHKRENPWGNPCYHCELQKRIEALEKQNIAQICDCICHEGHMPPDSVPKCNCDDRCFLKANDLNIQAIRNRFESIEQSHKKVKLFLEKYEVNLGQLQEAYEMIDTHSRAIENFRERIKSLEQERDKGVERLKEHSDKFLKTHEKFKEHTSDLDEVRQFEDRTIAHLDQIDERLEALESRQSPEQYNKVETAPELQDELRLSQQNPMPDMPQFKATDEWYKRAAVVYQVRNGDDLEIRVMSGEDLLADDWGIEDE